MFNYIQSYNRMRNVFNVKKKNPLFSYSPMCHRGTFADSFGCEAEYSAGQVSTAQFGSNSCRCKCSTVRACRHSLNATVANITLFSGLFPPIRTLNSWSCINFQYFRVRFWQWKLSCTVTYWKQDYEDRRCFLDSFPTYKSGNIPLFAEA